MSGKVRLLTLGCPKNLVDSEKLAERLRAKGVTVSDVDGVPIERDVALGEGDIVLINTCGFIEDAKKESIEEILRLSRASKSRGGRALLVVFGCLAKRYGDELKREIPEIDSLFGVGEEEKIIEYCLGKLKPQRKIRPPLKFENEKPYAYIKIAEGCDRGCSYCVIPSIRGKFRSLPPEEALKDAEKAIKSGKKELILVSQDLLSYGKGPKGSCLKKGYDLNELIKDMASISGDFWIRPLYLNPASIDDAFLGLIAGEKKLVKYLDIPFQHSEERVLRLMGRPGGRKKFLSLIKKIRETVPDVALRTTLIVGFPGETKEEFEALKGFVSEARFERLGVFKYSKEEGTRAAGLKGHIGLREKDRRLDEVMRLQAGISLEKNKGLVGKKMRAIVDEPEVGRIYSQAPEIDGVTIINGEAPVGKFVKVKITGASDYDLMGEPIRGDR